jgi:Rap1a immunity proteins
MKMHKAKILFICLSVLMLSHVKAFGAYATAGDFYDLCHNVGPDSPYFGSCNWYVVGIVDSMEMYDYTILKKQQCIALGVSAASLRQLVVDHMSSYMTKDERKQAAALYIDNVISRVYHCHGEGKDR